MRKPPPAHFLLDKDGNLQFVNLTKANLFADSLVNQFKTANIQSWIDEVVEESIVFYDNLKYQKLIFVTSGEV